MVFSVAICAESCKNPYSYLKIIFVSVQLCMQMSLKYVHQNLGFLYCPQLQKFNWFEFLSLFDRTSFILTITFPRYFEDVWCSQIHAEKLKCSYMFAVVFVSAEVMQEQAQSEV